MSVTFAPLEALPELIFGLVGPIGVDLSYVYQSLSDYLRGYNYDVSEIRISEAMRELKSDVVIEEDDLCKTYESKIDYANDLRRRYGANDILAAVAIGAIKNKRDEILAEELEAGLRGRAFVVRQLKTPEETKLFRSTYGRQFIQLSIYGNQDKRRSYLADKIKIQSNFTKKDEIAQSEADRLILRDKKEAIKYGQNVSDAFPMGDLFIDNNDKETANRSIERFLSALFGSNEVSPTREEYGMYLAKTASLRSSDLSRQVGAAIISKYGEVITLGSNEVPKARGGSYWSGDSNDARDFRVGVDQNQVHKSEVFTDVIDRLFENKDLSDQLLALGTTQAVVMKLLSSNSGQTYTDSRVMDIIEFGRMIHAEMSAICDAARNGNSVRGAVMYVTAFPCHICAKHIVASGVSDVVYLEPYPKSYAQRLHSDSIQIDEKSDDSKVHFVPFMGISPFRYRDLFEKGKRKTVTGEAIKWQSEPRRPNIDVIIPNYKEVESVVIAQLVRIIAEVAAVETAISPSRP